MQHYNKPQKLNYSSLNFRISRNQITQIGKHNNAVSASSLKKRFSNQYKEAFEMATDFIAKENGNISSIEIPRLNLIFFLLLLSSMVPGVSTVPFTAAEKKFTNDCLKNMDKNSMYFKAQEHYKLFSADKSIPFLEKLICEEEDCKEASMAYDPIRNNIGFFMINPERSCEIYNHEGLHYSMSQNSENGKPPKTPEERHVNALLGEKTIQESGMQILTAYHVSLARIEEAARTPNHHLFPKVMEFVKKLHDNIPAYKGKNPKDIGEALLIEKERIEYYIDRYCGNMGYCEYAIGEAIANAGNTALTPFIGVMHKTFAPDIKIESITSPGKKINLLTAVNEHTDYYNNNLQKQIDFKKRSSSHEL